MAVAAPPSPATPVDAIPPIVERLRATFAAGRTRSLAWRRDQLGALARMLADHEESVLGALHADLGRPRLEGWTADVALVTREIDHLRRHLTRWAAPRRVALPWSNRPGRARVVPEPLGVALVVAPWNYPVQLALLPAAAAIAAGNAVVIKPSEVSAASSALVANLVERYLDPDAFAVVEGGVPETEALLAERFDHIFYTGNGRVGRIVMEAAARHLTPVTLELGGKSPAIVDRRADLTVAARRIAWGRFMNTGQTCVAPDFVLVDRTVEQALLAELRDAIRSFYGDDPRASADYGRIVNERHLRRLRSLLDGGRVVVGGTVDPDDRYLAPTVLTDVDLDAAVMQEEIFGPILPVVAVDDVDAAIAFVNERDRPLALYVFSEDRAVTERVVARTSSGGVCVNATMLHLAVPDLPFGGVGPSGFGAYHGRAGFETFSHHKSVLDRPSRPDPSVAYPPYGRLKERVLRRFL